MVGSMTFSLCLSIIFSIFFPCLSAMRYFFWVMHVNFKLTRSSSSQKIQCVRLFVFVVLCLRPFLEHLERFFFFFFLLAAVFVIFFFGFQSFFVNICACLSSTVISLRYSFVGLHFSCFCLPSAFFTFFFFFFLSVQSFVI